MKPHSLILTAFLVSLSTAKVSTPTSPEQNKELPLLELSHLIGLRSSDELTIDPAIQKIVEEQLSKGLARAESKEGCIIVLSPVTGAVLGLAQQSNTEAENYAFRLIEPGQGFKVITAAAALNENLINASTKIDCENGIYETQTVVVRDDLPHDRLTLEEIVAKSSNIGIYKLGRHLGTNKFYEYVEAFGFGKKTVLNWTGEKDVNLGKDRHPQEFAFMTYGYGLAVSPMQMAISYSTIANNGKIPAIHIVKSKAQDVSRELPEVITPRVAKVLRKIMTAVTKPGGTASDASPDQVEVAGKTGTVSKWEDGEYKEGLYICTFGGMFPAVQPEYVVYVVIDSPQTTKMKPYGATIAAPIFKQVSQQILEAKN